MEIYDKKYLKDRLDKLDSLSFVDGDIVDGDERDLELQELSRLPWSTLDHIVSANDIEEYADNEQISLALASVKQVEYLGRTFYCVSPQGFYG